MGPVAERLLKDALELTEAERADLAASLLESLSPEFDEVTEEAWQAELRRRWEELESGKVQAIPWEVVNERLKQKIDQSKNG